MDVLEGQGNVLILNGMPRPLSDLGSEEVEADRNRCK